MNSGQGTMGSALGDGPSELSEEVPVGYKRTEVGVIPEDWMARNLGSCLRHAPGYGINAAAVPYDDRLPTYLRITDISEDYRFRPSPRVSVRHSSVKTFFLSEGDLVFARTGASVGKSYHYDIKDGPLVFAGFLIRISPDPEKLEPAFLAYCVQSERYWEWVAMMSIRSGQPGINGQEYAMFQIPLPSPSEQRAIADELSDVDGLLAALDALIAKKRAIKQAAMQQVLTGKTRLPGFSGAWEARRIGDISDVDPENLPSGTNPAFTFNYISLEQVDAGRLLGYLEERFRTAPSRARRVLRYGDVLMSTVRPVLMAHLLYREQIPNAVCSTGFAVLRAKPHLSAPGFLFAHLLGHVVNEQIKKTLAGSNYPAINGRDVRLLEIPCPPKIQEQHAIAAVLSDMDAEIAVLERRRDKTCAIKQGMMQQLLTGRIRLVKLEEVTEQTAVTVSVARKHNWQFNEAVVISALIRKFGSKQYPLGRMRYTKLSYLLHRREEGYAEGYLKKAAGPYNPRTRYGGPEKIALQNDYVRQYKSGKRQGFVEGTNVDEAERYFDKWYGSEVLPWLEKFRYKTNDDLELLTTVDMAAEELRGIGEEVSVESVREVIHRHPEWNPKLDRPIFTDVNLARAIEICRTLFAVGGDEVAP